jgi:hypothetical protein
LSRTNSDVFGLDPPSIVNEGDAYAARVVGTELFLGDAVLVLSAG